MSAGRGAGRVLGVRRIAAERVAGASRVRAEAAGEPVWFESADAELRPAPEAFGCALLLAALDERRTLELEGEVSRAWLANVAQLLEVFREW